MAMKDIFPIYKIGHFINEPENPTEFEIVEFGKMAEPEVEEIHKHHFYEIIWVTKGRSKQVIDYAEYELSPCALFFISPGQVHRFEEWEQLEGGSIFFTEDYFLLNQSNRDKLFELSFLDNTYSNPSLKLDSESRDPILRTIGMMLEEKQRRDPSDAILHSLLHLLVAQIQRLADKRDKNLQSRKYLPQFKCFRHWLEKHYATQQGASEYASQLNITQHHLNFICKQVTGKTATGLIRERKMLEARRMLTYTSLTISEIAARLDYFDSSYFSRVFKATTGLTPLDYKSGISEKSRRR